MDCQNDVSIEYLILGGCQLPVGLIYGELEKEHLFLGALSK